MTKDELIAELANARAALDLIEFLATSKGDHLGRPRFSGIAEGCISCIAGLGKSRISWADTEAEDFLADLQIRRELLQSGNELRRSSAKVSGAENP